jgi:hypothetical protein
MLFAGISASKTGTVLNTHRDRSIILKKFSTARLIRHIYQICTAIHLYLNQLCTMNAKSTPYPPRITMTGRLVSHHDNAPGTARRVTPTNYTAGPSAVNPKLTVQLIIFEKPLVY